MLKLYHNDMSVCAQKVRMVLAHKQLEWDSEHLNLRAGDQHKPAFKQINAKGLIPVLEHDGAIIPESTAIVEYLDDVFPTNPVMPQNPLDRAKARTWLLRLDAGLHEQVAVISFCFAFRFQLLERYKDEAALREFIANIPDPYRISVMEDIVFNGKDSPRLKFAVLAYEKLLKDMATALAESDWLVGDSMSSADIGFIPYIDRLDQLGLSEWWQATPQIGAWIARVRASEAYKQGIGEWLNENYIGLMGKLSDGSWDTVSSLRP